LHKDNYENIYVQIRGRSFLPRTIPFTCLNFRPVLFLSSCANAYLCLRRLLTLLLSLL
jgi:hypothetical protein